MSTIDADQRELLLIIRALEEGYTFTRVSLFDEEGVDGWQWHDPAGHECGYTIGYEWPPVVPSMVETEIMDDLRLLIASSLPHPTPT